MHQMKSPSMASTPAITSMMTKMLTRVMRLPERSWR